jgi:hypothetical protein
MRQRFLRPAHLVVAGAEVWLVDELHPVAAVLRPADRSVTIIDWRSSPVPGPGATRTVLSDSSGILAQDGAGGPIAWIGREGICVQPAPGVVLRSAGNGAAWLVAPAAADPGAPGPGDAPHIAPPLPTGLIVALSRTGARQEIRTERPVLDVQVTGRGLLARFAERPVGRRRGRSWRFEYPSTSVIVPWDELFRHGNGTVLAVTGRATVQRAPRPSARWTWLRTEPWFLRRYAVPAGGLLWSAGALRDGDRIERHAVVTAHDAATFTEMLRVDLGIGAVTHGCGVGRELWVAVARRRHLASARDRGVEIVAVSTSGQTRTVLPGDSIDITGRGWAPVRPATGQISEQKRAALAQFSGLGRHRQAEDGPATALAERLPDLAVTIVGEWPDIRLEVIFAHRSRPGLRLCRRVALFDELGRPRDLGYAVIHLLEDLDTGYIAPAEEAVNGYLET